MCDCNDGWKGSDCSSGEVEVEGAPGSTRDRATERQSDRATERESDSETGATRVIMNARIARRKARIARRRARRGAPEKSKVKSKEKSKEENE